MTEQIERVYADVVDVAEAVSGAMEAITKLLQAIAFEANELLADLDLIFETRSRNFHIAPPLKFKLVSVKRGKQLHKYGYAAYRPG